jgi:multidrug transporter EmrE-like cation transporter
MSNLIIALYVLTTSLALVILKLGAGSGAPIEFLNGKLALNLTLYTIFGIILYGISFILYMYLISKFDLGYIIPLCAAIVYVLIFFASFVIFKESFTAIKIAGIGLILVGLVLLNISK